MNSREDRKAQICYRIGRIYEVETKKKEQAF